MAKANPKANRLLEFLVLPVAGLAFIGFLAWLGVSVSDIRTGQGEMRVDLGYTKGRVDRIVEQIPTLRRQIAQYQIHAPAREAVVTTRPVRRDSATSIAAIHVINFEDRKATSHYITLSNVEVRTFNSAVAGAVVSSAPSALSFGDMAAITADTSIGGRIPAYIDVGSSFMMWSAGDSVSETRLTTVFVFDSTKSHRLVTGSPTTWGGVVLEVSGNRYSVVFPHQDR